MLLIQLLLRSLSRYSTICSDWSRNMENESLPLDESASSVDAVKSTYLPSRSSPKENKDNRAIKEEVRQVLAANDEDEQKGCGFWIPYVFQCSFSDDGKGEASVPVVNWLGSMFATTPKKEPPQIENNKKVSWFIL